MEKKKQWTNKKIFSIFTVNGTVRLKLKQDGPCNSITHLDDLKSLFPEKNFVSFFCHCLFTDAVAMFTVN